MIPLQFLKNDWPIMLNFRFSGHETFVVRTFWPKKGYDFLNNGGRFSAEDAVVDLGIGKNMVSSMAYWMKAFGLTNLYFKITNYEK